MSGFNPTANAQRVNTVDESGNYVATGTGTVTTPDIIGGEYLSTPPTLGNTNTSPLMLDINGNEKVTLGTTIAGEDIPNDVLKVEQRFSYNSITTQTTTTVKSGVGFLHAIVIPTPVASATVKIYDNTAASGTVLLDTITFPATLLSSGPISLPINASFSVGLTIVTAGATMSLTAVYR